MKNLPTLSISLSNAGDLIILNLTLQRLQDMVSVILEVNIPNDSKSLR